MTLNLEDYATGIVVTAPSPAISGTTLVLQSGEGLRMPPTPFAATLHPIFEMPTLDNAEKIIVTDVTGDTLTITRAQGNTNAQAIESGWRLTNAIFSDDLHQFVLCDDLYVRLIDGTQRTQIVDANGRNSVFQNYGLYAFDVNDDTYFYAIYQNQSGSWIIIRIANSDGVTLYANGASDAYTNWAGRASLTYNDFATTFI